MIVDTSPGSPDGPPLFEDPQLGPIERAIAMVAKLFAIALVATVMVGTLVAMVWGIAWMLTNFPSR